MEKLGNEIWENVAEKLIEVLIFNESNQNELKIAWIVLFAMHRCSVLLKQISAQKYNDKHSKKQANISSKGLSELKFSVENGFCP